MNGLYWSYVTELQSSCKHPLLYLDAFLTAALSAAVSFCCVYVDTERKACNIYLHILPNAAHRLQASEALTYSLELLSGGLNQSCATVPRWSNLSIAGSYIRSYEIKRLLDNKNICNIFYCRRCRYCRLIGAALLYITKYLFIHYNFLKMFT